MEVRKRKNESTENLIKRFIKKSKKAKIVDEVIERRYYKKPSKLRREAHFRKLALFKKLKDKERREKE